MLECELVKNEESVKNFDYNRNLFVGLFTENKSINEWDILDMLYTAECLEFLKTCHPEELEKIEHLL